ncbi:hypothetical protein [Butyrivibrio sp. YAB3001]|uniref:hypothetical protein n=1 Tax=Butyrivibrio sp. YAB3001 TaxID=1520812 RepID=UPI0008F6743B|nr:hypothetical protein [Butyrivibrio sp. YAB3001]SFC16711.1 hypothetical protein SAMN02910398_01622 [Butyrivibrio sp. YAB3001]
MVKSRFNKNIIASMLILFVVMMVTAILGDYFFDLNDDCLMKDILSGSYTGTPEGNNIQMLYPISLCLSLFYRISRAVDWYGIFLCFSQYLCIFLIVKRIISFIPENKNRVLFVSIFISVILGFYVTHLLYVQYTVVCAFMSATAAFLILTAESGGIRENILSVILIIIAFLLRSEMLLLTLPMAGVAIFIKWCITRSQISNNDDVSSLGEKKKLFFQYLKLCVVIIAGLLVCSLLNKAGYSRADWKEFNRLFDNRTELYDFQSIPDYQEHKDFYDSIGLSESEQKLLVNYNFGLDDEIDADLLGEVAEYAKSIRGKEAPVSQRLTDATKNYIYRLHSMSEPASYEYPMTDFPWNLGIIILYIGAVIYFVSIRKTKKIWYLVLLFACRSSLWMYIILRGRDPIRITHPLYYMEILILLAVLMISMEKTSRIIASVAALTVVTGIVSFPAQVIVIQNEKLIREEMLAKYRELSDYFEANPDSYYLIDVYTSVSYADAVDYKVATYSEKMFENVNNNFANQDILGGWASKSPVYYKKLNRAGYSSAEEALLSDNVYFVQTVEKDTKWLEDYYLEKGQKVEPVKIKTIADVFVIYHLDKANED